MQQYFCEVPLKPGEEYIMTKAQAYHAGDVLHMHQEKVRLVSEGKGYFGTCFRRGKDGTSGSLFLQETGGLQEPSD